MLDSTPLVDLAYQNYQSAYQPTPIKANNNAGRMSNEKIDAVAQDFEAFFISMMMESMMSGLKTNGFFGGGQGEKVFRSVLVQEYGKESAKQGGFGIADSVREQLLKMQETQASQGGIK